MGRSSCLFSQHLGLSNSPVLVPQMCLCECCLGSTPTSIGELDTSGKEVMGRGLRAGWEEGWF